MSEIGPALRGNLVTFLETTNIVDPDPRTTEGVVSEWMRLFTLGVSDEVGCHLVSMLKYSLDSVLYPEVLTLLTLISSR